MKILLVNKFHYLKGGSEKYYFDLAKLLKEHGHEVAFFSMQDEKNIKTDCKEYFVENSDMNSKNIFKALDVIYSKKNKKAMEKALDDFKPDIVHLNNFQRQLSASIIKPIKKRNIPIVFTAHDLQAICPEASMLDKNKCICEKCLNGSFFSCFKKKCIKNSYLKSFLGMVENDYYKKSKIYYEKIDYIITPSEFYKKKLVEYGVKENKIIAIHNFIDMPLNKKKEHEEYIMYFGRISVEKGIFTLLEAFSKAQNANLFIAGSGPDLARLKSKVEKLNLQNRVKILGFLNQGELKKYIDKCKFVIVPSIWYENCPYSILETMAEGKAILASNIGGIPELIENKKTGILYEYNNINDLADKIEILFNKNKLAEQLGNNARKKAIDEYSKEYYYSKLIKIYDKLLTGEKDEG